MCILIYGQTYLVQWWYAIDLWSIGGGGALAYVCILPYVEIYFSVVNIPYIYGQLEGGTSVSSYMCILLYVKFIWCSGIL